MRQERLALHGSEVHRCVVLCNGSLDKGVALVEAILQKNTPGVRHATP